MGLSATEQFSIGSLVRVRERDWVVLPSDDPDILKLRPLSGSEAEACGILWAVEGNDIRQAEFPEPNPERAGDFIAGRLLRDAARLSLRSGAGPFRSLGRLSVRPRPYQFVPLIMALRLDPVRLLGLITSSDEQARNNRGLFLPHSQLPVVGAWSIPAKSSRPCQGVRGGRQPLTC